MKNHAMAAATLVFLSGCATTDLNNAIGSFNNLGQSLTSGLAPTSGNSGGVGGDYRPLAQMPLYRALSSNLSTDGSAPEWPKVVVTDLTIPQGQTSIGRSFTLKPNECATFNAVLWRGPSQSERIDKVALCAKDLPKQSNNFVTTWRSFPISGKTTGQARTDGPTPPYSKLPTGANVESWMMNQFGLFYVGSMLTMVGYDQNFSVDDRRFWVKNVKE